MKTSYPALKPGAGQHGFTLVELLVGVALGSVVLASLGGILLVSEVKVSATIQRNLVAKDDANRAIDLMRGEARRSSYIRGPVKEALDVPGFCDDAPIAYVQARGPAGQSVVCYKTLFVDPDNPSTDLSDVYRNAFAGQCVLLRKGPSYLPNGELEASADPVVQVLLVGPATPCTLNVALSSAASAEDATLYSRNADIQIALDSSSVYTFSAKVPSNPAFDGNNFYTSDYECMSKKDDECKASQREFGIASIVHFKARSDIVALKTAENLFYFDHPYLEYILRGSPGSGSCTYESCYVSGGGSAVQLTNVDALIFPDKEIRPR